MMYGVSKKKANQYIEKCAAKKCLLLWCMLQQRNKTKDSTGDELTPDIVTFYSSINRYLHIKTPRISSV